MPYTWLTPRELAHMPYAWLTLSKRGTHASVINYPRWHDNHEVHKYTQPSIIIACGETCSNRCYWDANGMQMLGAFDPTMHVGFSPAAGLTYCLPLKRNPAIIVHFQEPTYMTKLAVTALQALAIAVTVILKFGD